jgi:hypothetical protein
MGGSASASGSAGTSRPCSPSTTGGSTPPSE